jgi:microcystin-dependent protein
MTSVLRKAFSPTASEKPTVGDTKLSLVSVDHLGWLICDGRTLNIADFQFLYNVVGSTYGGTSTTFNLPNPAGRVLGVIGSGATLTTRAFGASVGTETHTLITGEMPIHLHTITDPTHTHGVTDPGHQHSYVNQPNTADPATSLTTMGVADNANVTQQTGSSTTGLSVNSASTGITQTNNTGGSLPHNNMQPTLFVGNMFVYCGRLNYGTYPYTVGSNIF